MWDKLEWKENREEKKKKLTETKLGHLRELNLIAFINIYIYIYIYGPVPKRDWKYRILVLNENNRYIQPMKSEYVVGFNL